ncbi:hypothetical protein HDU97_004334 [Phlyctochytrium planicorne]|nr:hypothetical protein HDU97_004334 [Phlyctochytrium planicorne]
MGCTASVPQSSEVAESKLVKRRALKAINHGERWRSHVAEFLDAMEKSGFIGALWAEDERDQAFADVFKRFSLHLTELSVISRSLLTALDDHLLLLTDIFALQREHHDSVKRCVEAYRLLQATQQKEVRVTSTRLPIPRQSSIIRHSAPTIHSARTRPFLNSFGFGGRRRGSMVSPEDDASAESLDIHLDVRAEARAQVDVNEAIKVLVARRDRLDKVKGSRLPLSLVDLLLTQGNMWLKASDVFKKMCEVGEGAGWNSNDSSIHIDRHGRNGDPGDGLSPGLNLVDMDISMSKRRLKLLKRWCLVAERAALLWQDLKELERGHAWSCLEWLKDNKTFFVTLEDQTSRQRQNIERPQYLQILEGWLSVCQYHTSLPEGTGMHLSGPNLAAYDSLLNFSKVLFHVKCREEEAVRKIKSLAISSTKARYTRKLMPSGKRGSVAPSTLTDDVPLDFPNSKRASKSAKEAHKLETDRHRLTRLLADNRHFRKAGVARVQFELWISLEGCAREIGGNYQSTAQSFQKQLQTTARQAPPSYDSPLAPSGEQSPVTLIVTHTRQMSNSRDTLPSIISQNAQSIASRTDTQRGFVFLPSINSESHPMNVLLGQDSGSDYVTAHGHKVPSSSRDFTGADRRGSYQGSMRTNKYQTIAESEYSTSQLMKNQGSVTLDGNPLNSTLPAAGSSIVYDPSQQQSPTMPLPHSVNASTDYPESHQRRRGSLTDANRRLSKQDTDRASVQAMYARRASTSNAGEELMTSNKIQAAAQAQKQPSGELSSFLNLKPRVSLPPITAGVQLVAAPQNPLVSGSMTSIRKPKQLPPTPAPISMDGEITDSKRKLGPASDNVTSPSKQQALEAIGGGGDLESPGNGTTSISMPSPSRSVKGPPPPPPLNPTVLKTEDTIIPKDQSVVLPESENPLLPSPNPSYLRQTHQPVKAYSIGTTDELYAPGNRGMEPIQGGGSVAEDPNGFSENGDKPSEPLTAAPGSLMAALEARLAAGKMKAQPMSNNNLQPNDNPNNNDQMPPKPDQQRQQQQQQSTPRQSLNILGKELRALSTHPYTEDGDEVPLVKTAAPEPTDVFPQRQSTKERPPDPQPRQDTLTVDGWNSNFSRSKSVIDEANAVSPPVRIERSSSVQESTVSTTPRRAPPPPPLSQMQKPPVSLLRLHPSQDPAIDPLRTSSSSVRRPPPPPPSNQKKPVPPSPGQRRRRKR